MACGDATMEAHLKSRLQMGALKNTHLIPKPSVIDWLNRSRITGKKLRPARYMTSKGFHVIVLTRLRTLLCRRGRVGYKVIMPIATFRHRLIVHVHFHALFASSPLTPADSHLPVLPFCIYLDRRLPRRFPFLRLARLPVFPSPYGNLFRSPLKPTQLRPVPHTIIIITTTPNLHLPPDPPIAFHPSATCAWA